MPRKTFNSKYASDEIPGAGGDYGIGDPYSIDDLSDEINVPGLPTIKTDGSDIDFSDFKGQIVETNDEELIKKRNRYVKDPVTGEPDLTRPTGNVFYRLKSDLPAIKKRPAENIEGMRAESAPSTSMLLKQITAAIGMVPALTENSHEECGGTGLVYPDGSAIPCSNCQARGHNIIDPTLLGGHAELQEAIGNHNVDLQNHRYYCDAKTCFNGCPIEKYVRPIREARSKANNTIHSWDVKPQLTGTSKSEFSDYLKRKLPHIILEDLWLPTHPGLTALSARNNLEGAATTNVRPGDIVNVHGYDYDPGAMMLVTGVNSRDGSLRGFQSTIGYEQSMAEREMRRSRSKASNGLTYDLINERGSDGLSSKIGDSTDMSERDSIADLNGRRLMLAGKHITVAHRLPTDLKLVSGIDSSRVSKTNEMIASLLQQRGSVLGRYLFGDVTDNRGQRLRTRTLRPFADSTYASPITALKMHRGANPFSAQMLYESLGAMQDHSARNELYSFLEEANRVNMVSSGINRERFDPSNPLNLLPPNMQRERIFVRTEGTPNVPDIEQVARIPDDIRTQAQKFNIEKTIESGRDVTVEPPEKDDIVKKLTGNGGKGLRMMLESRIGRELNLELPNDSELFDKAMIEFTNKRDIRAAHAVFDPSIGSFDPEDLE
jgi:hypothetical protein